MKNALDLTDRQMDIFIAKSELKRIKFFIAALSMGLLIMSVNFFVVSGTTDFFNSVYSKYVVTGWFIVFLIYEIVGHAIAKVFLRRKEIVNESMKMANVFIEALFPSLLISTLCYIEGSVIFLDSPIIFFYFVLMGISALNLETKLVLTSGIISSVGYLAITIWAINTFDSNNQTLHFPPALYIARSFFMMIASLASVFVANEIRKRTRMSIDYVQQKNEIEMQFGQQVSQKVVEALKKNSNTAEEREVTILFMDVRNFSFFAENKPPEEVIKYQNQIFDPLTRIINNHNGITNQILGDGLMATFGAPIQDPNHAENALKAGLEMLRKIEEMSDSKVIPQTRIGIGANTGNVVMGNIGNELRKQFSISGTAVIIAARLEQMNKTFQSQFLISKSMYEQLGSREYEFEHVGETKMHNIKRDIDVYRVA